jgi:hypothetical protein
MWKITDLLFCFEANTRKQSLHFTSKQKVASASLSYALRFEQAPFYRDHDVFLQLVLEFNRRDLLFDILKKVTILPSHPPPRHYFKNIRTKTFKLTSCF